MRRLIGSLAIAAAAIVVAGMPASTATPKYFPDDPIWQDNDRAVDAVKVGVVEDANGYDFVVNTFVMPGEHRDVHALNVNTVDEVPDSSWFQNRIGRAQMSVDQVVKGPDRTAPVSIDGWVVSAGKSSGVQPGFRMVDPSDTSNPSYPNGQLYQIEIDPESNPEMASGAEIIGTAFYHAIGYHTVDVYLAELDPAKLVISPDAKIFDPLIGEKRTLSLRDVNRVLERASPQANGKFRVLVSRFAAGTYLGNFRYYGTRPDDPNDIVPHEHRRELRGARVFAAWLNHDDSRGVNSLDFLETAGGKSFVRHYMFDFGSILGSGTVFAQRHRAGNEYIFEQKPGWLTLATLGLYTRPWLHINYPPQPPSIGRIEADAFDPVKWKPEYPNTAFDNMRADDAFWAARIVAKFTPEMIRGVVAKARYSDPRATEYLIGVLLKRQKKVLTAWLAGVNPLVDFTNYEAGGDLTFVNAAVAAGVATDATSYTVQWARLDNATGQTTAIGGAETNTRPQFRVPAAAASMRAGEYLEARVSATHASFPTWATPVTVHFRRTAVRWETVGITRGQ
ncbi:MAG TPA: hypothetical protein VFV98_15955 [Vicinamibacterales bacterium]|nr:hypothetical protein [Vicinamibacterales bacterium]